MGGVYPQKPNITMEFPFWVKVFIKGASVVFLNDYVAIIASNCKLTDLLDE